MKAVWFIAVVLFLVVGCDKAEDPVKPTGAAEPAAAIASGGTPAHSLRVSAHSLRVSAVPGSERNPIDVSTLLEQALALGEATWPGAKVGGVKVGEEVPEGGRSNVYAVRVSFEFDADPIASAGTRGDSLRVTPVPGSERNPIDPTAKSGSVLCSPECDVIRHKVKRTAAPPFPCTFAEALDAARKTGFASERPLVGYGYWNFDERQGWTFRAEEDGPVVEIGAGCAVVP